MSIQRASPNDLDSGLFQCPPTSLEIFLAWFTNHYVLAIVLFLSVGWILMVLLGGIRDIVRR